MRLFFIPAVICFAAAVLAVYLAEFYVFLNTDDRDKAAVVMEKRRAGLPAAASMYPSELIKDGRSVLPGGDFLPLGGISDRPVVQCIEYGRDNFGWVTERSDERGFNNPPGAWAAAPPDIVIVGDSFAHGECVPRRLNIASALNAAGRRTLNLGMPGNGPLLELAGLVEYARRLRPPLVLWLYYRNDLDNLAENESAPILTRYRDYADHTQNLWARQKAADTALAAHHETLLTEALARHQPGVNAQAFLDIALLRHLRTRLALQIRPGGDDHEMTAAPSVPSFAAVLRRAHEVVNAWSGELVFVYLPAWLETAVENPRAAAVREDVLAAARAQGLRIIDLHPVFKAEPGLKALWQCEKCHYSARGYALAGAALAAALNDGGGR